MTNEEYVEQRWRLKDASNFLELRDSILYLLDGHFEYLKTLSGTVECTRGGALCPSCHNKTGKHMSPPIGCTCSFVKGDQHCSCMDDEGN